MDAATALSGFLTVFGSIFVVELTDKDALLVLVLATRVKPFTVFAAGSIAFTITSAIIVSVGSVLVEFVPVPWIKVAGGSIMIAYGLWTYTRGAPKKDEIEDEEKKIVRRSSSARYAFASMILSLVLLDLAGDATEVLTIVLVAHVGDALLVFVAAVSALVLATLVMTAVGNRVGRMLDPKTVRYVSATVFVLIGSAIVLSTLLG